MRYNSKKVVLVVVNYMWKFDHLSLVIQYFVCEKKFNNELFFFICHKGYITFLLINLIVECCSSMIINKNGLSSASIILHTCKFQTAKQKPPPQQ